MSVEKLKEILRKHKRVVITGGPLSGKTELAKSVDDGRPVYHTDEHMDLPWSEQPLKWIERLKDEASFVLEGVQVPRTLRKGLEVDAVVYLGRPKKELTSRQAGMSKGVRKVYDEWRGTHREIPEYNL